MEVIDHKVIYRFVSAIVVCGDCGDHLIFPGLCNIVICGIRLFKNLQLLKNSKWLIWLVFIVLNYCIILSEVLYRTQMEFLDGRRWLSRADALVGESCFCSTRVSSHPPHLSPRDRWGCRFSRRQLDPATGCTGLQGTSSRSPELA